MRATLNDLLDAKGVSEPLREAVKVLIDRLEAAEKERDALRAALRHEADCVEACKSEIEALRAKIEQMEKQKPIGWLLDSEFSEVQQMSWFRRNEPIPGQIKVYALPGAKGEEK